MNFDNQEGEQLNYEVKVKSIEKFGVSCGEAKDGDMVFGF